MITLTPAYGRDYKTAKAVRSDWNIGKDFIISDIHSRWDGKPANNTDMRGEQVMIRFNGLRKVTVI